MKKKSLLLLLFIMCVGYLVPNNIYALGKYNNINVDYRFTIIDDDGKQQFTLKDKNEIINLQAKYNDEEGYYYFEKYSTEDNMERLYERYFSKLKFYLDNRVWINYDDGTGFYNFPEESGYVGGCGVYYGINMNTMCSTYTIIPLILENKLTHKKNIVFGTYHISYIDDGGVHNNYNNSIYSNFSLGNNNSAFNFPSTESEILYYWNYSNGEYNLEPSAVQFMRNAIYDYNDELWEQLNSEPIASSEMQYDNSDTDLSSPKLITFKTNNDKAIYSKYKSNINYRFKVKNGNGMNFKLHDVSNTFSFSSKYDKDSDTYSIVDNSTDTDYQDGIKEFSKIIIDEVKNGNFSGLANKYKSITSDRCSESSCNIYTYIPLVLEGENKDNYAKQIVLGLVDIQYRQENGNDYYDIGLSVYNNTCDLLSSDIDVSQSELINLSRAIEKDYSNNLINQYSDGSIALEDIYDDVDVNTLKDEYCNDIPVISLKQNPKTWNNGIIILIGSLIVVIVSSVCIIKRKNVKL